MAEVETHMSSEPPVWLLDVDGVINASRPDWGTAPRREHVWSPSDHQSYLMRWAPGLIDRIRALHASGTVEVRWCSTWCPDAEALERLWRLPPLERALTEVPVPKGAYGWPLKVEAARAVLAGGRRLVWTDDEAVPTSGVLHDELTADGRALLIAPNPTRGLQPDHVDDIEAFLHS